MKKVLILGYKGTLGQELVKIFTRPEFMVTTWDREEVDITSSNVNLKILNLHPDIIINATGYNAVDKAESDPVEKELCFKLNSLAPENLAIIAKDIGAVFVNYSTDYVFKGDSLVGYKEDDQPDPINVYGESKYEGEKRVQSIGGKYYIIRPSRIFGIPGVGANSKKSFVDVMIQKKDEAQIKVVNEEKGSPTYAPDLADFTFCILDENYPFGIYHGANNGGCTWYEWTKEIFNLIGVDTNKLTPITGSEFKRPAKRPMFTELINSKTPLQPNWQDALKRYLK